MNRSKVRAAVSWFFIIATIVLIQISISRRIGDKTSADSALSMQVQMSGRYFIGIRQFTAQNPALKKRLALLEQGIKNSQRQSRQLSGIPILAELSGRDAALEELERMAANPGRVSDLGVFYQLYRDGSASLDSDQVKIVKGYGWVGRLALSQDKPDSDPARQKVLKSALYMVILVVLFTMAALAALLAGLVLFFITIVRAITGKLESHLMMPEKPATSLLEAFAVYMVLSVVLPLVVLIILPGLPGGGILMSVLAGFLPILWPFFRGAPWRDYFAAIGWHRGKGIFHEVGAGIVGYITGMPLMVLAIIAAMILAKYTGQLPSHPAVFDLSRNPLLLFLLACVYAPFVEETLFRGALYGYLRRFLPWIVSAVISSLIFAVLHPQGWVAVPAIGAIGFNLSAIREWRGSAIASMTAHALNNGSLVLILVISLA